MASEREELQSCGDIARRRAASRDLVPGLQLAHPKTCAIIRGLSGGKADTA